MKRQGITAAAIALLAAAAFGAVQMTARDARVVCIPPAVAQAWS